MARRDARSYREEDGPAWVVADPPYGERLKGPMPLILGPLGDPAAQFFDLAGREGLFNLRRRHDLIGVVAVETGEDLAPLGGAGDDGLGAEGRGAQVKAEIALARFFVGSVALEALV